MLTSYLTNIDKYIWEVITQSKWFEIYWMLSIVDIYCMQDTYSCWWIPYIWWVSYNCNSYEQNWKKSCKQIFRSSVNVIILNRWTKKSYYTTIMEVGKYYNIDCFDGLIVSLFCPNFPSIIFVVEEPFLSTTLEAASVIFSWAQLRNVCNWTIELLPTSTTSNNLNI